MEDKNKTVAQLIADLQNQLDKANNRIDELAEENNKLKEINNTKKALKIATNSVYGITRATFANPFKDPRNVNNTQFENLHGLRLEYNGLCNKFRALDTDYAALISKYCDYNKAAQDAWNENNKIKNEIEKLKNENEYLEGIIDRVISENDDMSKEITKWHNKYTKEKAKHDKATKKIDELKKHQKGELTWSWSDKRRHDNLDSLLYSYWGLKEYYQEAKCNKNEANDVKE